MSDRLNLKSSKIDSNMSHPAAPAGGYNDLRVAVVHDWLVTYGGAERVLEQILALFPKADLFTLCDFFGPDRRGPVLNKTSVTSFLQKMPFAAKKYRSYLPLMPMAVEQFDLSEYDLVISSSHAVAHGVLTTADQLHLSYFNNTMVYAWDLYHHYLRGAGLHWGLRGMLAKAVMHYIRTWDAASAGRVDRYIANSYYMARRIAKLYGHEAKVIYPPVDVEAFALHPRKSVYYIAVSRLVPFKRIDLVVEAFNRLPDRRLIILGDGPQRAKLQAMAEKNIRFLGFRNREEVYQFVKNARGFLFPSEEPFGIAAVEAQAAGTPVIAYRAGAATEIVIDGETGMFFNRQTPDDLVEAIKRFEDMEHLFEPEWVRENATRFSVASFRQRFARYVDLALEAHFHRGELPGNRIRRDAVDMAPRFLSGVRDHSREHIYEDTVVG
jgi:glycosyltransferase involved in cell wall biosynthesis